MIEDTLATLYRKTFGVAAASIEKLPSAGSSRKYYRLSGAETVIGTYGADVEENRAFTYLCRHFGDKGLPVPELLAVSHDCRCYLQSDLGNVSLFDYMATGRREGVWSDDVTAVLEKTVRLLPDMQWRGADGLDFRRCYPVAAMDLRSVMWDLNYFKYCFLKTTGLEFSEVALEDDFERLASTLLSLGGDSTTFMYRDFQSRNVMLCCGEPCFIDFQGGRRGPCHYDLVSFLWQAKAAFPDALRDRLISAYVDSASRYTAVDEVRFRAELRYFVLFRTLQVLGAYGFRGYVERKPHFLQSIPAAIANLRRLVDEEPLTEFPALNAILSQMVALPRFTTASESGVLTVKVASFGYKRHGIPADNSGNGGGFVFDCRGLHNPGRYPEYKTLTGRDPEVIEFLEKDGGITVFLDHAFALVDASVANYLERGFTSLSVSFGCTGGQHRSVYSAEHMAAHLAGCFPQARIELTHYEQGISLVYEPKSQY